MGQLQDAGNVTTLAAYLDILDECTLLTGLQKYARDVVTNYDKLWNIITKD